jgi:hypothetical protein
MPPLQDAGHEQHCHQQEVAPTTRIDINYKEKNVTEEVVKDW